MRNPKWSNKVPLVGELVCQCKGKPCWMLPQNTADLISTQLPQTSSGPAEPSNLMTITVSITCMDTHVHTDKPMQIALHFTLRNILRCAAMQTHRHRHTHVHTEKHIYFACWLTFLFAYLLLLTVSYCTCICLLTKGNANLDTLDTGRLDMHNYHP